MEGGSDQHEGKKFVTREYLDLKLASFRSEMRLLFVVAIAGNSLISHLSLGAPVSAILSGVLVGGVAVAKALIVR